MRALAMTPQLPPRPRAILLLPVAPWLLPYAALSTSILRSFGIGAAAAALLIGLVVSAEVGVVFAVMLATWGVLIFISIPGTVWFRLSQRGRAITAAILLCPVTLLVPAAVWAVFGAPRTFNAPNLVTL